MATREPFATTTPSPVSETSIRLLACAAFVVAVVAYLPSLQAQLVSDDFLFVRRPWGVNLLVHLTSPWEHELGRATAYRPLTVFSYGVNQALGSSATAFHFANVLVHGVASAMCVWLTGRLGLKPAFAGLAGIAFALHPVHHEAVSWIAGRTAVLSGAFAVASAWAMCRWAHARRHVWLASGLAVCALLCYEGALLLPVVLLAVALLTQPEGMPRRAVVFALTPVCVAWVVYLLVRWIAFSDPQRDVWALSSAVTTEGLAAPVLVRAMNNVQSFVARMLAAGVGVPPLQSRTFVVTATVLVISTGIALLRRTAGGGLLLAVSIAAASFAPFVTYTGYADRFSYLASLGVCLALAIGAERTWAVGTRATRGAMLTAVLLMLSLWTRQLLLTQGDWVRAGVVAAEIPRQARQLMPALPHGAHVRMVGVPLNVGAAYVYITYFDLAIRQAFGRDDITVSMSPLPTATCSGDSQRRPFVCFRWDGTTGTLSKILDDTGPAPSLARPY